MRHPKRQDVKDIFERVVNAAKGAALGTGTTVEYEVIGGTHDLLLNRTLGEVMQKDLEKVGGITYTPEEMLFAKKIQATFTFPAPDLNVASKIKPLNASPDAGGGSTDVGTEPGIVERDLLRRIDCRVGMIPGYSIHLVDI